MRFQMFRTLTVALMLVMVSFAGSVHAQLPPTPTPSSSQSSSQTICNGTSCSYSALVRELMANGASFIDALGIVGALQGLGFTFTAQAPGGANRFALGGQGETGKAGAAAPAAWNGYAAAARANIGSSFQPTQAGGSVDVGIVGIDYTFSNRAIVGAAVAGARARLNTTFNGGNVSVNSTTLSPYLLYPVSPAIQFDANAGFGRSSVNTVDNSVAGGIRGANNGSSTSFGAGLTYRYQTGRWGFSGRGGLSTSENKNDSLTLSNNTFVASATNRTSSVRLGAQALYNAGQVMPFAGITYVYDFQKTIQGAVLGQTPANDRDGFLAVAGLQFTSRGSLYGGIQLTSELGRKEVKNNSIVMNVGIRF